MKGMEQPPVIENVEEPAKKILRTKKPKLQEFWAGEDARLVHVK